jgi:hypothetical protein
MTLFFTHQEYPITGLQIWFVSLVALRLHTISRSAICAGALKMAMALVAA